MSDNHGIVWNMEFDNYMLDDNFQTLKLAKIAYECGNPLSEAYFNDPDRCIYDTFLECLFSISRYFRNVYDEEYCCDIIMIKDKRIYYYSRMLESYIRVFGADKGQAYINELNELLREANNYSYSYGVDLTIKTKGKRELFSGIRIETTPEFSFFCDCAYSVYSIINFCETSRKKMKDEIVQHYKILRKQPTT